MKIDPYKHKEIYLNWKKENELGIEGISKQNSNLIFKYLYDMEKGINISAVSIKGSRSFARLNSLKNRLTFFSKKFKEIYKIDDITKINEEQLLAFFSDMKNGIIKKFDGKSYKSVDTYAKIFKAFWHWHQKVNKKNNKEIPDITTDLDTKQEKPKWVYLTEEQVKKLCENCTYDYRVLITFIFDSGIRSPGELINVKVSDLYNNYKELHIREEISKTFGRRIKLMLCSNLIKEYVRVKGLKSEDYLFSIKAPSVNKYLKRLALKLFGDKISEAGEKYSNISLYDFRHISCCYWLPRYKSESALKYRFGWRKSDKIHYYSEMLGMRDTISEEDLLIDVTKTEIEKRLTISENEKEVLHERVNTLEVQMKKILQAVNGMVVRV